jgi:hypothetical protein
MLTGLIGTRGRVQRSIRVNKRKSCTLDNGSVGRFGSYWSVAAFSPEIILHQAKVDIKKLVNEEGNIFLAQGSNEWTCCKI